MLNIHATAAVIVLYVYSRGFDRTTAVMSVASIIFCLLLSTVETVIIVLMYHSPTGMDGTYSIAALLVGSWGVYVLRSVCHFIY